MYSIISNLEMIWSISEDVLRLYTYIMHFIYGTSASRDFGICSGPEINPHGYWKMIEYYYIFEERVRNDFKLLKQNFFLNIKKKDNSNLIIHWFVQVIIYFPSPEDMLFIDFREERREGGKWGRETEKHWCEGYIN